MIRHGVERERPVASAGLQRLLYYDARGTVLPDERHRARAFRADGFHGSRNECGGVHTRPDWESGDDIAVPLKFELVRTAKNWLIRSRIKRTRCSS